MGISCQLTSSEILIKRTEQRYNTIYFKEMRVGEVAC